MQILEAFLAVMVNCIVYMAFGSFASIGKKRDWSLLMTMVTGFFLYYALFFVVCIPIMLTYRPLSLLSHIWLGVVVLVFVISVLVFAKQWRGKLKDVIDTIMSDKVFWIIVALVTLFQILLVTATYNFTLDAAYYVANVSTSVNTNMINVYDPFTGGWQDHFELRYVFATYSIHDAVLCSLTGIPALVETKTVMAAVVIILSNALYIFACRFFYKNNTLQSVVMYIAMIFVNLTFITLYTSSNFLMTRTYEGKAIVGNVSVIVIFLIYMLAVREGMDNRKWFMLFVICVGTATVSSTANMIIPAQLCVLFVPYIVKHKKIREAYKLIICMLPEVTMMLLYVLYVKGFFAVYTYPR